MSRYIYAEPTAPKYEKPTSVGDCLPQARELVIKLGPSQPVPRGVSPNLFVREGDRILVVTLPDQDNYVAEAISEVLKEKGAQQVDFIDAEDLLGTKCPTYSVEDGWREADDVLKGGKASGADTDVMTGLGLGEPLRKYLESHPEYNSSYADIAGANILRALGDQKPKHGGYWVFNNWEWFRSKANTFPFELLVEMEKRIVNPLEKASAVRITDPEGTYMEYSLTAEEAKRWQVAALYHGHLLMDPLMATSGELRRLSGYTSNDSLEPPPVFHKLNGVLAGTANHSGFFPRIELHFEDTKLVDVKGGGRYGDSIREMLDQFREIQWPGYPDKGFFWFCDAALCTSMKAFRRASDMFNCYWLMPNLCERTRAGVFHHGFGSRTARYEKDFAEYAQEHNLPRGHIHVHNYFSTFEIRLGETNHWHKIIDKGYITALSDPDFRAIAARYGLPEELTTYDWVPPLPGINCEGNYLNDYAPDPIAYLKKRLAEGKPI